MTTFHNIILNKRDKQMSDNSEKLYTRNLEKLNENKPVTDLKFSKKTSKKIFLKSKNTSQQHKGVLLLPYAPF